MLTVFQRLLLGGLLLLALVTGLSLLVRGAFLSLSALDGEQKQMDRAVAALATAQASLAREQILVERSLLHLPVEQPRALIFSRVPARAGSPIPPPREAAIRIQSERAEQRLLAAQQALSPLTSAPTLGEDLALHHRILERLRHVPPELEARRLSARELEPLDESLFHKLTDLQARRATLLKALDQRRSRLEAKLIAACTASILTAAVLVAGMLLFTMRPLRRAAQAARRIGQGDLRQRIDWPRADELGILATEFNRLAIRLRDLRETEAGRREMERQLSDAIVQSIFEPVIVTDGRGQILTVNNAARSVLGEAAAADRMGLAATEGGDRILAAIHTAISLQQSVAGGSEGEIAAAPIRIGHAQRNFRLRATPMRDRDGHLLGAVTVLEDITELQALDQFKTRFLAIASQKLYEPLERLRLAIHALARGYAGELRPLQADVVEGAQQEAERMDDLMADLLAVAEIDTGKRSFKPEKLSPLNLLREAQASIRVAAAAQGLAIEVEAFADLPAIEADRRALRSIFENLLSNAVRNTDKGGRIRLMAREDEQAIRFSVSDTGRGIEPERLSTIFGRFTSGSTEGTGLGLALVRRLVESQGGHISVESRVGAGTTFIFTLPSVAVTESRHPVEAG